MPDKNLPTPVVLDPDHEIDLVGGRFSGTNADQLTGAFKKFAQSGARHLYVFFHGGLVSREDALQTANWLMKNYTESGAYPFFFIWNSGLLTAIQELLSPHKEDASFVAAANRLVALTADKIATVLELDSVLKKRAKVRVHAAPLDLVSLADFAEPYEKAWLSGQGAQLLLSKKELAEIGAWLLDLKPEAKGRVLFKKTKVRGPGNPFGRVIQRLNSGHGHGLYTTVIEELFIAIGAADALADPIWGQMKSDIDAAFKATSDAGGSAFLQQLASAYRRDAGIKVTLIGHSAGAIYVQKFIEEFDRFFASRPDCTVEVITLAAAVSFERMNAGLAAFKQRVNNFRMFGLSDRREGGYWEIPGIYNKSLLYIVCSLCENDAEADRPLVGMQRYWSGTRPYDVPYINAIADFVDSGSVARTVWSPSPASAARGFRSAANRHGGFPEDFQTSESVCYLLKAGF